MGKLFRLSASDILPLVNGRGSCIASDSITVSGKRAGFMYREKPDTPVDSGWRFFAGDESQEVADDPTYFGIFDVNTIANYDPEIIPLLDKQIGTAWRRNAAREWEAEAFPVPPPSH